MPEIKQYKLDPKCEFFIIACDGIWDCLTSAEAVSIVGKKLENRASSSASPKISDLIGQVFDSIIASDVATS